MVLFRYTFDIISQINFATEATNISTGFYLILFIYLCIIIFVNDIEKHLHKIGATTIRQLFLIRSPHNITRTTHTSVGKVILSQSEICCVCDVSSAAAAP